MARMTDPTAEHIQEGQRCFVALMGHRYLISILRVREDRIRVSFPVSNVPVDGMRAVLEFHDPEGVVTYESEVLERPKESGDGMVLSRPHGGTRMRQRGSWRVPTSLTARLKGHVHPREYDCTVTNLSAGGALVLLREETGTAVGDDVELTFALPNRPPKTFTGEVVHIADPTHDPHAQLFAGIQFISPDPADLREVRGYVWQRMREIDPAGADYLRQRANLPGVEQEPRH